ncbi:hypothetical protein ABTY98_03530 [Streptomyces sp. NPDC096040]|uniref:hypothetical protein n=1 Tax=Streptomyces sp. NPDC096040 TaxID=3155541 RepID=UPI00332C21D2
MPVTEIASFSGAEHCGWQSAYFPTLGEKTCVRHPHRITDDGDTAYVRTSQGVEAWPKERRVFACD